MGTQQSEDLGGQLPERELLQGFLDWYRAVVIRKVEGLPHELAIRPTAPSIMSALGIVQHLGWVERNWSRRVLLGEEYDVPWNDEHPDADFTIEPDQTVDSVIAWYCAECASADAILSTRSLDATGEVEVYGSVSVRWMLVHLIEETARHAGHLDLICEQLDGRTGD